MNLAAPATILIVDDEPDLTLLLSSAIQMAGHRAVVAGNGLEALELLKTLKPALIVLDMNMPKMGGVAFYNELAARSGKGRPEFPVLVLTARANLETLFKDLEIEGFMTKPFDIGSLMAEVEAILRSKSVGGVPPRRVRKQGQAAHVLVVEDNDAAYEKIHKAFVGKGLKVTRERFGAAAIERAKAESPDVALIKMSLKDLSGDAVGRTLKTMPVTSGTAVVLYAPSFAGSDRTALDILAKRAGADHALETDDPVELLSECERALNAQV